MPDFVFQDLGRPLAPKPIAIEFVTQNHAGAALAWGTVESPDRIGVFAIDLEFGEVIWLDVAPYGRSHIRIHKAPNGAVYIYAGNPGRFLKYDIASSELVDLGVPAEDCNYWLGHTIGPDGLFYIGSYPETHLVSVDPKTDEIRGYGKIATDPREKYIVHPVAGNNNIIYCPVGLHHRELWAYDAGNGAKTQILSEQMMEEQGSPRVWMGDDMAVYGSAGECTFRCMPDRIEEMDAPEPAQAVNERRFGNYDVVRLSGEGRLILVDANSGEEEYRETQFQGASVKIYSVSCEHNGKIYGGGFQPANTFEFDVETGVTRDIGMLTTGTIQVYDTLSHEKGLFLSSYMGCNQDFFDPISGDRRHIGMFATTHEQERGQQLAKGPDGMIYAGSVPIKGMLGGSVVRIDPGDFEVSVWRNVVASQSLNSVVSVPETDEMFFTSTVRGGTSALPSEKEACVMLWDVRKEEVSWMGHPVRGTEDYGRAVMGVDGYIYGLSGASYYVFDPTTREVLHTAELPVHTTRWPGMAPHPGGARGLIIGLGDDAVFALDSSDLGCRILARHESVSHAQGMYLTTEGMLYYGSGASMMGVDLSAA
ncbi:MAG: hypothetical protein CME25_03540 [Gemmatimonadetes bacterium]|nr:hypothetical protein [Gemmatimonadota bacterium]